jgi:hypothetical protein
LQIASKTTFFPPGELDDQRGRPSILAGADSALFMWNARIPVHWLTGEGSGPRPGEIAVLREKTAAFQQKRQFFRAACLKKVKAIYRRVLTSEPGTARWRAKDDAA